MDNQNAEKDLGEYIPLDNSFPTKFDPGAIYE